MYVLIVFAYLQSVRLIDTALLEWISEYVVRLQPKVVKTVPVHRYIYITFNYSYSMEVYFIAPCSYSHAANVFARWYSRPRATARRHNDTLHVRPSIMSRLYMQ